MGWLLAARFLLGPGGYAYQEAHRPGLIYIGQRMYKSLEAGHYCDRLLVDRYNTKICILGLPKREASRK